MLSKWIAAAAGAGLTDSLVLDHPDLSGAVTWPEYIASCVAAIDAKFRGRRATRPRPGRSAPHHSPAASAGRWPAATTAAALSGSTWARRAPARRGFN